MNLIDISIVFINTKVTHLFWQFMEHFSKIFHILRQKESLNKYKRMK